jgi:hypothetical protein
MSDITTDSNNNAKLAMLNLNKTHTSHEDVILDVVSNGSNDVHHNDELTSPKMLWNPNNLNMNKTELTKLKQFQLTISQKYNVIIGKYFSIFLLILTIFMLNLFKL